MASIYGYLTVANLENDAGKDYSAISSKLTDTVIEAQISNAERYINTYVGTVFTGTIPDGIVFVTSMIAQLYLRNWMIDEGIGAVSESGAVKEQILEHFDLIQILESYKDLYAATQSVYISKQTHVNEIPTKKRRPTSW